MSDLVASMTKKIDDPVSGLRASWFRHVTPRLEAMDTPALIAYAREKAAGETPKEDVYCKMMQEWLNTGKGRKPFDDIDELVANGLVTVTS